ncbi:MAG: D-alanine--D-alanine ligase [Pseudomonadota bacterium]
MKRFNHIGVIKGGWSPERAVSLVSGAAAATALRAAGYTVTEIDATPQIAGQLETAKPDAVFNALHGQWGEDGCVQGLLEILKLPYTHSGVLASSLAIDKQRAKQVFAEIGVPVPAGQLVTREDILSTDPQPRPYVVKPNNQGSSVGIHIIRSGDNRPPALLTEEAAHLGEKVLVEEFIPGRELTVAVMGDRPLGVTEIIPATDFYDYEAKYASGGSRHVVPADLPKSVERACLEMALAAHEALGCRGLTRADFRLNGQTPDGLFCLEINTQPGLTPTSLAPEQAAACGYSFEELVTWMMEDASCHR